MTEKIRIRVNQALTALVAASAGVAATLFAQAAPAVAPDISRTPPAEVKYQPLDPRDKAGHGPQIAIVFGDLQKKAPVGFLFKVPPGFRPGPHTHTQD